MTEAHQLKFIQAKYLPRSSLGTITDPPRDGGGERARLGGGRPLGAGDCQCLSIAPSNGCDRAPCSGGAAQSSCQL
jgi:hypothetical protein